MNSSQKQGVVYIATGKRYIEAAIRSARSIKKWSPTISIHLFCDVATVQTYGLCLDIFDSYDDVINPHYRSKVDYLVNTPYQKTVYLDSDTRIIAPIDDIFDILERYDVAICHAHRRNHSKVQVMWNTSIPYVFPQLNGGVIAFRSNDSVLEVLNQWKAAFHEAKFKKDQVTLRELLWNSNLRIWIMPPEYNIRYLRYYVLYTLIRKEARPTILHLERYNYTWWQYVLLKLMGIVRLFGVYKILKRMYADYRSPKKR